MSKIKRKGVSKKSLTKKTTLHYVECSKCGQMVKIDSDSTSVLCSNCTIIQDIKLFGLPIRANKIIKSTKPAGWHFMQEFVDLNGDYYIKGELITEKTKKIPTIKTKEFLHKKEKTQKNKLSKSEKKSLFSTTAIEYSKLKKQLIKLEKSNKVGIKGKIKKLTIELKKLSKLLIKYK